MTTARAESQPEIYALVIGHNGGTSSLHPLRFADDDAVRYALFFSAMRAPTGGRTVLLTRVDDDTAAGLARADLPVHVDGAPTRSEVTAAFAALGQAMSRKPSGPRTLYVVYAGHGLRGRLLLEPENGAESALTGDELRASLADLAAIAPDLKLFLFVDACRSESLFSDRGAEGPDFGAAMQALEARAAAVRLGVLTAAWSGKPAAEVAALRSGSFSHALMSALAGAADADGNDVVTFGELAAFVAFNTRALTGQLPWFDAPNGDLAAPAMDHRGRRGRLALPATGAGRYLIGAAPGTPIFAEAFKDRRRPLRLALPPGHYRVTELPPGAQARTTDVQLRAGENAALDNARWTESTSPAALERGAVAPPDDLRAAEFSAPFSSDVVSALTAGYHAGRSPPAAHTARTNLLALEAGAGRAPLGTTGVERGGALVFQHFFGSSKPHALLGLRGEASFAEPSTDRSLNRFAALLEGGWRFDPLPHLGLSLSLILGAGAATTVVRSDGPTRGDRLGPLLRAAAEIELPLPASLCLRLALATRAHWVEVNGARTRTTDPSAALGLGVRF